VTGDWNTQAAGLEARWGRVPNWEELGYSPAVLRKRAWAGKPNLK